VNRILATFWCAFVYLALVGFMTGFNPWCLLVAVPLWVASVLGVGVARERIVRARVSPLPASDAPRLELKAPSPRPGQCPVCSLEDLEERAADDAFMGDTGTALARVVKYGPDRAHSECAAVVPYEPPLRSTSGGTYREGGIVLSPEKLAAKERCVCKQCHAETGRPYLSPDRKALEANRPKRGKLRESFVRAMAEEAAAAGEKLQRELGL
jgi:hypothetical protein